MTRLRHLTLTGVTVRRPSVHRDGQNGEPEAGNDAPSASSHLPCDDTGATRGYVACRCPTRAYAIFPSDKPQSHATQSHHGFAVNHICHTAVAQPYPYTLIHAPEVEYLVCS
jgi:hypothetical protein